MRPKLGVDIGGVIASRKNSKGERTYLSSEQFLDCLPMEGVYDALRKLAEKYDLYIVSRGEEKTDESSETWLNVWGIDKIIPPNQCHRCRKIEEKGDICARLGITHFVDDRKDVLDLLPQNIVRLHFQTPEQLIKYGSGGINVESWKQVLIALL